TPTSIESCSASGFLDLDFLLFLRHLRRLGQVDVQYPFVKLRLDLRRIGIKWQRDRSAKRAIAAFHHVPVLVLVLFIPRGLFLAADSQQSHARTSVSLPTICRFATYSCPRNLLSCSLLGMKTRSRSMVSRVHGFSYVNFRISQPAGLGSI